MNVCLHLHSSHITHLGQEILSTKPEFVSITVIARKLISCAQSNKNLLGKMFYCKITTATKITSVWKDNLHRVCNGMQACILPREGLTT